MRAVVLVVLVALVALGCGTSGSSPGPTTPPASAADTRPQILPLLINSEILKGANRFLFSITDRQNALLAAPDVAVKLAFFDVDTAEDAVAFETESRFIWAIKDESGLYASDVTFPDAGRWGARFTATFPDGRTEAVRADFDVAEAGTTPTIGAPAPSIDTPTLADVGGDVALVSTDNEPVMSFYETSIEDALAAGAPFVVAFATPAFCETRLCGPALDAVKEVAAARPGLTVINVEPYRMVATDGRLQPDLDAQGQLQAAAWTEAWGLRTEPYTFLVAADGTIVTKLEGVFAADELTAALDAL